MNFNELFVASFLGLGLAGGCRAHDSSSGQAAAAKPLHTTSPDSTSPTVADADAVIDFWMQAGPGKWFAKDPEFDALFRQRFASLYELAAQDSLRHWERTPTGALALLILLDQYPRNSFRRTPRMYATDALARRVAADAVAAGHDRTMPNELKVFAYLPFSHSEDLADQERAVELCGKLGEPHVSHAKGHRDIIKRFGRFPHRNPILGRAMTPEEQRYLDEGGFAG